MMRDRFGSAHAEPRNLCFLRVMAWLSLARARRRVQGSAGQHFIVPLADLDERLMLSLTQ